MFAYFVGVMLGFTNTVLICVLVSGSLEKTPTAFIGICAMLCSFMWCELARRVLKKL